MLLVMFEWLFSELMNPTTQYRLVYEYHKTCLAQCQKKTFQSLFDWLDNTEWPVFPKCCKSYIPKLALGEYRKIVLVGFLGKIFGPLGFAGALITKELPLIFGIHIITNDLVGAIPFVNAGETLRTVDDVERRSDWASGASITTDDWELIYDVEPGFSELYNISSDSKQEKNVIKEHPDTAKEIHSLFCDFMKETKMAEYLRTPRTTLRL